jgi:endonuclease G
MSYTEHSYKTNGEYICTVDTLLSIGKMKTTKTVKAKDLKKYNKQYIRTCSVVVGSYISKGKGKPIFLNFGRSYPNQYFSAVIWKNNRSNFSYNPVKKLLNKEVCIKGEVSLYKGRPSINLKDESQIEF